MEPNKRLAAFTHLKKSSTCAPTHVRILMRVFSNILSCSLIYFFLLSLKSSSATNQLMLRLSLFLSFSFIALISFHFLILQSYSSHLPRDGWKWEEHFHQTDEDHPWPRIHRGWQEGFHSAGVSEHCHGHPGADSRHEDAEHRVHRRPEHCEKLYTLWKIFFKNADFQYRCSLKFSVTKPLESQVVWYKVQDWSNSCWDISA